MPLMNKAVGIKRATVGRGKFGVNDYSLEHGRPDRPTCRGGHRGDADRRQNVALPLALVEDRLLPSVRFGDFGFGVLTYVALK